MKALHYLNRIIFLQFLFILSAMLYSCEREETDIVIPEGAEVKTVSGQVLLSNGEPAEGINVEWYYHSYGLLNADLIGGRIRLKGKAKTDSNGNYKIEFYQQDDEKEQKSDTKGSLGGLRQYELGLKADSKRYIDSYCHPFDLDEVEESTHLKAAELVLYRKRSTKIELTDAHRQADSLWIRVYYHLSGWKPEKNAVEYRNNFRDESRMKLNPGKLLNFQKSVTVPEGQTTYFVVGWKRNNETLLTDTLEQTFTTAGPLAVDLSYPFKK